MSDETQILTPEMLDSDYYMLTRFGEIQRKVNGGELAERWRSDMRDRARKDKRMIETNRFPTSRIRQRGPIWVYAERPDFEPTTEQRRQDDERFNDVLAHTVSSDFE
jgi:hypothetical protein